MRLLLLGKPGSGKGTQAKRIARDESIPAISTGDLIRHAIATGGELGQRFKSFTDRGQLVPDELVLAMVEERLSESDCKMGFLLDGFPRTVPQAEALEAWLVERAGGRRFCPRDGNSYHITFAPSRKDGVCDECGGTLEQRADDREEVVRARLSEYRAKTAPLISFYEQRGLLVTVDGLGTPDAVEARIEHVLHP